MHKRMLEHLKPPKAKKSAYLVHRHDVECHKGIPKIYKTEIVASESKIVKLNCLEGILLKK